MFSGSSQNTKIAEKNEIENLLSMGKQYVS